MKNDFIMKSIVVGILLLFVGTTTAAVLPPTTTTVMKTKASAGIVRTTRDQVELRYYDPETLSDAIGIQTENLPIIWKSAIRLTQDELAPYKTWNLTQVVIGFREDPNEGPMNVTIYIYAKGTATHPGNVIVNDTWAILSGINLITVPLVTPVSLSVAGREEVWVAVQWTQNTNATHYAFVDSGPVVDGKGDWIFIINHWQEISIDSNWAIGAVVEGYLSLPPTAPTINGPTSGEAGKSLSYTFTATDPEGDNVEYYIDWGNNETSYWSGYAPSGEPITKAHTWAEDGTYTIKAKAKDVYGEESDWGTLTVTMPLTYQQPQFRFMDWLFQRFPHAFPILRHLMGY